MVVGIALGRRALDAVIFFLADLEFAADDGLDSLFVRSVDEMHSAKDVAVVGHCHGGHAELFYTPDQLFDIAGAVQHGVIGM